MPGFRSIRYEIIYDLRYSICDGQTALNAWAEGLLNRVNEYTVRGVTNRCTQDNNAELLICGQKFNERFALKISPTNLKLFTMKKYIYMSPI